MAAIKTDTIVLALLQCYAIALAGPVKLQHQAVHLKADIKANFQGQTEEQPTSSGEQQQAPFGMELLKGLETWENIPGGEEMNDILLWSEQDGKLGHLEHVQSAGHHGHRVKRKIFEREENRWPTRIFYKFDRFSTELQRTRVRGALSHWEQQTCVRFFEVNYAAALNTQHLLFTNNGTRCGSFLGMVPQARNSSQFINLPDNCLEKFGTAVHEIGHALGLWHEHQRRDREDHVTVVDDNLYGWLGGNFEIVKNDNLDHHQMPYDFNSVMHYAATAGSKNGSPTLQTRDGLFQQNIGQRVGLSFLDAKVVNAAYCASACSMPLPYPCRHGGYQDPNNCGQCRCPDGLSGPVCDIVAPSTHDMCGGTIDLGSQTTVTLSSPGYPEGQPYRNNVECNWLIKAPRGHTIQLMFIGDFSIFCHQNICFHWVEVKNRANFAYPGPRFCCSSRPERIVESEGSEMLVVFRANWTAKSDEDRIGFTMALYARPQYQRSYGLSPALFPSTRSQRGSTGSTRQEEASQQQQGHMIHEPMSANVNTRRSSSTSIPSSIPTTTTTATTTTTTTATTTPSPMTQKTTTLPTPTTTRNIYLFTWSAWSSCSSNRCGCGGCSSQYRYRVCGGGTCPPHLARTHRRLCTRQCTKTDVVLDFSSSKPVRHCPLCCPGYRVQNGHCVPK